MRKTAAFLHEEAAKRRGAKARALRLSAVFATVLLVLGAGAFFANLYFTPVAFVDIDFNPSFELSINCFGKVLDVRQRDAAVPGNLKLRYTGYESAVETLVLSMGAAGYLETSPLVAITIQTDDSMPENELLHAAENAVSSALAACKSPAEYTVYLVSDDIKAAAEGYFISPAKYLAILDYQQVNPDIAVEDCKNHSISEIQELTRNHTEHHEEPDTVDTRPPVLPETDNTIIDDTAPDNTAVPEDTTPPPETDDTVTVPKNPPEKEGNHDQNHHGNGH